MLDPKGIKYKFCVANDLEEYTPRRTNSIISIWFLKKPLITWPNTLARLGQVFK